MIQQILLRVTILQLKLLLTSCCAIHITGSILFPLTISFGFVRPYYIRQSVDILKDVASSHITSYRRTGPEKKWKYMEDIVHLMHELTSTPDVCFSLPCFVAVNLSKYLASTQATLMSLFTDNKSATSILCSLNRPSRYK